MDDTKLEEDIDVREKYCLDEFGTIENAKRMLKILKDAEKGSSKFFSDIKINKTPELKNEILEKSLNDVDWDLEEFGTNENAKRCYLNYLKALKGPFYSIEEVEKELN